MSADISFDENQYKLKSRSILGQPQVPGIINFMLRKNIVKNEKQAFAVIVFLTACFFIASFYITYNTFFKQPEIPPLADEIIDVY